MKDITLGELKQFVDQALTECSDDTLVYLGVDVLKKVYTLSSMDIDDEYDVVLGCCIEPEEEDDEQDLSPFDSDTN